MALNMALKKKAAVAAVEKPKITRDMVISIYSLMYDDLILEVDNAIKSAKELVIDGAPSEMLIASLTEQYPMMAVYAEQLSLQKNNLTQEELLKAVEKFENDKEIEKLLTDITNLSEKFKELNDSSIVVTQLPEHITPEFVLKIAKLNADITVRVIGGISERQKNDKLDDATAASLAEKLAIQEQMPVFTENNITQKQLTAAILKYSSMPDFSEKIGVITNGVTLELQKIRAADMGISLEEFHQRAQLEEMYQHMMDQGMSEEQIREEFSKLALQGQAALDEEKGTAPAADKKKKKKKSKKSKKASKESAAAAELHSEDDANLDELD